MVGSSVAPAGLVRWCDYSTTSSDMRPSGFAIARRSRGTGLRTTQQLEAARSGALQAADHAAVHAVAAAGGLRACLRCKLRASPASKVRDRQEQRSRLKQCAEVERRAEAPVTFGQVRHRSK